MSFLSDNRCLAKVRISGFTLIELVIVISILAILAALIVPRYTNASDLAVSSALRQDLRRVRSQILVYKAQHQDVPPGYNGGNRLIMPTETDFIAQMVNPTNEDGMVGSIKSETYNLGPYMFEMPTNPVNGSSAILVISNTSPMPDTPPTENGLYGWIYKASTVELRAYVADTDIDGNYYYDY